MAYVQDFQKFFISKNNEVESYEGESYLPNLISNYGEEAPIQPLLYQNTKSLNQNYIRLNSVVQRNNKLAIREKSTKVFFPLMTKKLQFSTCISLHHIILFS